MTESRPTLYPLACACLFIGTVPLAGVLLLLPHLFCYYVLHSEDYLSGMSAGLAYFFGTLAGIIGLVASPVGLVLCIISIIKIRKSQGKLRGTTHAIVGEMVAVISTTILVVMLTK